MSAAAACGGFFRYEQARALSLYGKSTFLLLVLPFLVAVWSGVNCLFWLFSKVSVEKQLKNLEEDRVRGRIPDVDCMAKAD